MFCPLAISDSNISNLFLAISPSLPYQPDIFTRMGAKRGSYLCYIASPPPQSITRRKFVDLTLLFLFFLLHTYTKFCPTICRYLQIIHSSNNNRLIVFENHFYMYTHYRQRKRTCCRCTLF